MYYPRSFLKFILLGFLLVSLPLVYALAELILSLDRLESQGRQEVLQAAKWLAYKIPNEFWSELRDRELVRADAPLPVVA